MKIKTSKMVHEENTVNLASPQLWRVTTEGDCEGRTTRNLGEHWGTIREIAKNLSRSAEYTLYFKWISHEPPNQSQDFLDNVHIHVDGVDSKTLAFELRMAGAIVISESNYGVRISLKA